MIQLATYIATSSDLEECAAAGVGEVLIEPQALSRIGQLGIDEALSLAARAKAEGLRTVLVWDLLLAERELEAQGTLLQELELGAFDAVRAQDFGAARIVTEHLKKPLQLCLEGTNHNLEALQMWPSHFGAGLERLVLSIQLDEEALLRFIPEIPANCELLGAGPVQIFYSKRRLLGESAEPAIRAVLRSDDSAGRPLRTIQTAHGTFIYLDEDFFILDRLDPLARAGLHTVRIDLRSPGGEGDACFGIRSIVRAMRDSRPVTSSLWERGPSSALLFDGNKTSAVFKDLKKHRYAKG